MLYILRVVYQEAWNGGNKDGFGPSRKIKSPPTETTSADETEITRTGYFVDYFLDYSFHGFC